MNIKVPYTWLKNHLSTAVKAEEFQRLVSLSGPSVERIETVRNEPVLDIEVTTNRMDTASIRGIAREGAVILNHAGKRSRLVDVPKYVPKTNEIVRNGKDFPIRISVDHKLCPRVTAVIMSVKTNHSPSWLSTKLEQVDIRSLNNLIDITNYVMMEIGQPTHVWVEALLGIGPALLILWKPGIFKGFEVPVLVFAGQMTAKLIFDVVTPLLSPVSVRSVSAAPIRSISGTPAYAGGVNIF